MKRVISYGKHDATGNGRKQNEVTLNVCVDANHYQSRERGRYTDGEHFSVFGDVWNTKHTDIIQGGQCVDYIVEHFAKDNTAHNIRALWEVFHLYDMKDIPERFRRAIVDFVVDATNELTFDRKTCVSCKLSVKEHITDYGTYTNGYVTVTTTDGLTETITLSQGDEKQHPIINRACKVINWLYSDAPSPEYLSANATVTTNAPEYHAKKDKERADNLQEIKRIAQNMIDMIDSGNVGEKYSVALYEIKNAEKFLKEVTK
jgi:hypothetical protein